MPNVEFDVKVYDNKIEITPLEPILDNQIYEFNFEEILAYSSNRELLNFKASVATEFTPMFVSLESVKSLVEDLGLEDSLLLYYIREASQEAVFRSRDCCFDIENPPFYIRQYVRYRAAYDALFRTMMKAVPNAGYSGKLHDAEFNMPSSQASAKSVLNDLKLELAKWQEAVETCGGDEKYAMPRRTIHHIRNHNGHHVDASHIGRFTR